MTFADGSNGQTGKEIKMTKDEILPGTGAVTNIGQRRVRIGPVVFEWDREEISIEFLLDEARKTGAVPEGVDMFRFELQGEIYETETDDDLRRIVKLDDEETIIILVPTGGATAG